MEKRRSKKGLLIAVLIIVAIIIIGVIYITTNKEDGTLISAIPEIKSIKNEVITAENYEELSKKVSEEFGDTDNTYYYSYACMYYIMKDGMAAAFTSNEDESAMYINIYNKTIQQLIDEGKQLMKENDITVEKWKKQLSEAAEQYKNENII